MTWGRELMCCGRIWYVMAGQGASIIYHGLIHKYLEKHEEDIDGHIVKITHHAKKAAWEVSATVVKVGWGLAVNGVGASLAYLHGHVMPAAHTATSSSFLFACCRRRRAWWRGRPRGW